MRRTTAMLVLALVLLAASSAQATLTLSKRNKFDLSWWFQNTSTKYTIMADYGYYLDYNGDGLPDYLILLEDSPNRDFRLFTLDTGPTGLQKTFPANRTAGRDFPHQPSVFFPDTLYTPYAPSMDSPDLVLVGTNQTTNTYNATYTKLVFQRLLKRNPAFPTEATWSIDVVSSFTPQVYWPDVSYNGDDYPDFFIYNSTPFPTRQFVITCYDGRNGAPIWSRPLMLDPEDPGTGIVTAVGVGKAGPANLGFPYLQLQVLPHAPKMGINGDFDGDGKPDIFVSYSFGRGNISTTYSITADITMLNARGNFLPPYASAWTRFHEYPFMIIGLAPLIMSDYNRDGYVDLLLLIESSWTQPPPAVFEGYSLRTRQSLFMSSPGDFGGQPGDTNGYMVFDQYAYSSFRRADVNGDGWPDLDVYRTYGQPGPTPLRVGLFNAYAGGGPQRGRRISLQQFDTFNAAEAMVNDFNGDDLLDYVLLKTPTEPSSPTAGRITYRIANAAVSAKGLILGKQFDYAPTFSFPWERLKDRFQADAFLFSRLGDVDGDGMRDTLGCLDCGFDTGSKGAWDLGLGYVIVYDNTPGLATPPLTAELEIKVQGENWIPSPVLQYAHGLATGHFVDNNRDGFINDLVVQAGGHAVYALAFQYRVWGGGPPRLAEATYSDLDGNGVDAGDQVVLTLDRSVEVTTRALRASHFNLPVQGDSLGGAGFRVDVNHYDTQQIVLTLGQGAHLTPVGIFSTSRRTPNSPSGVDFATSLPTGAIRSLDGLSPVIGPGVDVRFNLLPRAGNIGVRGGTVGVGSSPDAAYTGHQIALPGGALPSTRTITLLAALRDLGVPGAFWIRQTGTGGFLRPATISAEYHYGDIDRELGYLESEMKVQQLVERPAGVFHYVPVPGVHHLSGALSKGVSREPVKSGSATEKVSVQTNSLNPCNSLGTPGVFAGLPIETVDERTVYMKPGSGSGVVKATAALLTPDSNGAYPGHRIEFPGYVLTTESDPQRLVVKIRTATLAERWSQTGGQAFPSQSGAIFVVSVTDALNQPLAFTTPVNMTVQFKDRPDPTMTDVVHFDGTIAVPQNLRLVRNISPDAVNFAFVNAPSQSVSLGQGTVVVPGLGGLTGVSGQGIYGVVAPPGATPTDHWPLYR